MKNGFSDSAMQAIMQFNDRLLERELQKKAIDLNARNNVGDTLLHVAAQWGKPESIEKLVSAGADINLQDRKGRTPLYRAISEKNEVNARALLDAGADPSILDTENKNALFAAINGGQEEMAMLLVGHTIDVNVEAPNDGGTPLLWAVALRSPQLVRALVDRGANIHHPGILQSAAFSGRTDHLEYLLEQGADINARNNWGATCLHVAAGKGAAECVKWLLARGADPTIRDSSNLTALDWAVNSMQEDTAQLLRSALSEAGADTSSAYDAIESTDPERRALLERTRAFLLDYEAWNAAACDLEEQDNGDPFDAINEQFVALLKKYGVDESRQGAISYSRDCEHSASNEQLWKVCIDNDSATVHSRMRGSANSVRLYEYEFVRQRDAWMLQQVWTVFGPSDKAPLIV